MATYKDAGVDIAAADETVDRMKPLVRDTFTPGVLTDIGAFGAFFQPDLGAFDTPVLVSSVDGVGTKLKVAFRAGRHDTVGEDLVNHCVNDIAVCGARPLFFLDYFSTGTLEPAVTLDVVQGFARGCKANGCALIGGETAEMPDLYQSGEYDLAGMVVGVVDKARIVGGETIAEGDVLLGLASTGLHTNGYSLARHVLFDRFSVDDTPDALRGVSVGEALLAVHRSYLEPIQALLAEGLAEGLVHVTGGGIPGNTARVVPDGLEAAVDYAAWVRPAIFELIQTLGDVPEADMRHTFNLGIGLIAVVRPAKVPAAIQALEALGEQPVRMGEVRAAT